MNNSSFNWTCSLIQEVELPKGSEYDIVKALLLTYPFYHDRASRQAVQQCLQSLLGNPVYSDAVSLFVKAYIGETSKTAIAPSNAFVLLEWGSVVLQHCATHLPAWDTYGLDVVIQEVKMLDLCLSSDARGSIKHSALVVTRRALRKLFKETQIGASAIQTIVCKLSARSQGLGVKSALVLGVVAGVCARLPSRRSELEAVKDLYYSFYVREFLGSRTPVAEHIVAVYNDFFTNFATSEDLHKDVVPALEKALLRAPEVVLNDLISPMIEALPQEVDLSDALADHLLKPLLTNVKSQNPSIRNGAMSAFTACVGRVNDDKKLEKVVDDVLDPLRSTKLPTSEQRVIHARMLSLIPYHNARSASVCNGLATTAVKESNEPAIAAETSALASHLSFLLTSDGNADEKALPCPVIEAFSKGLADKRPAVRRIWAMRVGEIIWRVKDQSVKSVAAIHFFETITSKMVDIFDEIIANPQPCVQSGIAGAAYVVVATYSCLAAIAQSENIKALIRKSKIYDRAFSSTQKGSLLNHRIYTKLSAQEEASWIIRALQAYSRKELGVEVLPASGDAWAQAFLYFITAADVALTEKKEAVAALHAVYVAQPEPVAELIIQGLWTWYTHIEQDDKDTPATAAKTGISKLYLAFRSIFPTSKEQGNIVGRDILCNQLIRSLALARPEILPQVNWIELCLQVGVDPGDIARSRSAECIDQVNKTLVPETPRSQNVNLAAYRTAAELAFVAPDIITPILVQEVKTYLATETTCKYGPTEVAIARTPEGTAFIDVLSNNSSGVPDKKARDYDTIKWEEEVRAQVARKKSQERKLTADEKAKVNAQIARESKIRDGVLEHAQSLKRGIGFILALATGPPTAAEVWMRPCLDALLNVITAGASLLVGNDANQAYISCANLVSSRLGSMRRFIGVATLRGLKSSQLSEDLTQEPLGGTDLFRPFSWDNFTQAWL